MGEVSPKTIADRVQGFSDLTISDLRANLKLEPSNYINNWRFSDLNLDNDPDDFGDGVILPEDPDGFWIYMSDRNSGTNTLAAQDTAPWGIDTDSVNIDTPYVSGHAPKTKQFAARIAPPIFFEDWIEVVQSTTTGFAAGDYLVAYTKVKRMSRGGKRRRRQQRGGAVYLHTQMSPPLEVTVGQSQHIRITLPDADEGVTHFGLWLSAKNGGLSTMRLQEMIEVRARVDDQYTIKGPLRARRSPPSKNENQQARRRRPHARKKRHGRGKRRN